MDGFKEGIYQFLHNGNRLRTDAILPLVEKLEELKVTLSTLDTYRFYTSSLLLSYEGLDPELHGDAEEQQMVISEEEEEKALDNEENNCPEKVQFVGMSGSISVSKSADFKQFRGNSLDAKLMTTGAISTPPTSISADNISSISSESDPDQRNFGVGSKSAIAPTAKCLPSESVAVYVIDFAHATHSNLGYYAKEHLGPDSGYIFGISNLIKTLREIYAEEVSD